MVSGARRNRPRTAARIRYTLRDEDREGRISNPHYGLLRTSSPTLSSIFVAKDARKLRA